MRIPLLSRKTSSLGRTGPDDPMPPLPTEPLYVGEDRGDDLPSPPFNSSGDDLNAPPPPRPEPRPASLKPGDTVTDRDLWAPGPGRMLSVSAHEAGTYPSRLYAVGNIVNLRWERLNGRGMWMLHYDQAEVLEELPGWLGYGPRGAAVAEVLETIAGLIVEQVMALPVPDNLKKFWIPVEVVAVPEDHPHYKAVQTAPWAATRWVENRAWAVDDKAGSHYYQGCYFGYNLHEPHWLSALGRAMNAASLAAVGDDLPDSDRIRREWAELVGAPASSAHDLSD